MRVTAAALAAGFMLPGLYPVLASLPATPAVGDVVVPRAAALAGLALYAAGAAYVGFRLLREPAPAATLPTLAAWGIAIGVSAVFGFDPAIGASVFALFAVGAIYHAALVRWYGEPGAAPAVLGTFLAVGTAVTLAALAMQATRHPAALYAENNGRAAGIFVTANQLAAFLVTFVPTAAAVAIGARSGVLRIAAVVAATVGTAGMLATFSRGGWLGLLVALAVLAAVRLGRRAALPIAIAAAAAFGVLVVRPPAHHNAVEDFNRVSTWASGVRVASRFPLVGVGPSAYVRVYPDLRTPDADPPGSFSALHPHNVVLSFLAETGVAGLALVTLGWWRYLHVLLARLRGAPQTTRWIAIGACGGLAGTLAQGMVDTVGAVELTFVWLPFSALALGAAGSREAS